MIPGIVAQAELGEVILLPPTTVFGPRSFIANSGGWNNNTFRQYILATQLSDLSATQIRLTISAATNEALNLVKAYVGQRSGTYGFAGTPGQLLFGGNPGVLIAANSTATSDWLPMPTDGEDDLVFSCYVTGSSTDGFSRLDGTGCDGYFKAGDDAANSTPSGYSQGNADRLRNAIQLIEVR